MYEVRKRIEISAAHSLELDYESKCSELHGHNWIIDIFLCSETLDSNGMVMDFTHINRLIKDKLDHKVINEVVDFNPTAENLAKHICDLLSPYCRRVDVEESRDNSASYIKDDFVPPLTAWSEEEEPTPQREYVPRHEYVPGEPDEDMRAMLGFSQEILGKTLNRTDMETLYWIHDELGFPADIILRLLEYCAARGKRSVNYVERVAVSWHERGLDTEEKIDEFLSRENAGSDFMYAVKRELGIMDRALTKAEEDYIRCWRDDFGMDEAMISKAYENTILKINKLSFPYMNKILSSWSKKGIHTPEAADSENVRKPAAPAAPAKRADNPMRRRMMDNINNDL